MGQAHTDIPETLKDQFERLYTLRGIDNARKTLWREQHANESCDNCAKRGYECTLSTGTSPLGCRQCLKMHRTCSKPAQARKALLIEHLRISAEQYDALHAWWCNSRSPRKNAKSRARTYTQEKPSMKMNDEDAYFDDSEMDGEVQAEVHDQGTGMSSGQTVVATKRKSNVEPVAERSGAKRMKIDTPGVKENSAPPTEKAKSATEAKKAGIPDVKENNARVETDTPPFHVVLRQVKRELEEVTTDLRFRRATAEEGVDMYDRIALKLGQLMEQYHLTDQEKHVAR
ncbi:hypothetical protein E1B28_003078 [Marasmius oreades]|uniref:Zn(2)-C6 fungal-type domain-containing protein n=1 Tax=Marasmius oreades TaxID=181124 RepID=A0A9P7UK22_9AGAR|nr:uncharacterized protein E1B28_003078 [Marasmius oreades]KAG7085518.1 hypothetical protein E1B28_003078 [Marasmius oreades]